MNIGGLDIGTTGCKLTVYDDKAQLLAIEYEEYNSGARCDEINAGDIFGSVGRVIEACAKKTRIDVIGVTSFGETFVLLGENDEVLYPSMLYTHSAGKEECEELDKDMVCEIAGTMPNFIFSLPKIMWVKKHHEDAYNKAKRILLMQDYIVYMLTGRAMIDYSLAARTMGLDIKNKCWSKEIFAAAGVSIDKMSELVPSGTPAGKTSRFGLSDTVIVCGCHDQIAATVGTGAFCKGTASDGIGTVECITPIMDNVPKDSKFYQMGYPIVPFINEGQYATYALNFAGGASVKWYKTNIDTVSSFDDLDGKIDPSRPCGIIAVPHFAGASTPALDADTKAVFSGLCFDTTKEMLYQALLEGTSYEMLLNLEVLEENGIAVEKLIASGGGAKSSKWLQIKANIFNRPVVGTASQEAGTVGTIMIAGVANGAFESLEAAKELFIQEKAVYYPNKEAHLEYMKQYEKYKALRNSMKKFM